MSQELTPLFPSATHPALPVATKILSTLRHLTAPGKGNDLRPEERVALVGVAALLACERVQSNDLALQSVQRASSVSPARFKSALATSRRLLSTADQSPLRPRPRRTGGGGSTSGTTSIGAGPSSPAASSSSSAHTPSPSTMPAAAPPPAISPFQTPRKAFRYTSGLDFSGLHAHSPSRASPLKQSVTPSRKRARADEERDSEDGGEPETPSKRARPQTTPRVEPGTPSRRAVREAEGVRAFFAMRPGSDAAAATDTVPTPDVDPLSFLASLERVARPRRQRVRVRRAPQAWTFGEEVWRVRPGGGERRWRELLAEGRA